MTDVVLSAESVSKVYAGPRLGTLGRRAIVRAVNDVTLRLCEGETVGIVGESGCGKSTLARVLLVLEKPTAGMIRFRGVPVENLSRRDLRLFRETVQVVFQDPYSSLSPRMRIRDIVAEPLVVNRRLERHQIERRVRDVLDHVGLPAEMGSHYPHELSGGQRQRVAIARALSSHAKMLILDEPVSSLDVSVRAQVLNLLRDLQTRFDLTYLFISHDLSSVRYICRRVIVMYLGRIVEEGPAGRVLSAPMHPYTQLLRQAAMPRSKGDAGDVDLWRSDEVANPLRLPSGCAFHPRCPHSRTVCVERNPETYEPECDRVVACHGYVESWPARRRVDDTAKCQPKPVETQEGP